MLMIFVNCNHEHISYSLSNKSCSVCTNFLVLPYSGKGNRIIRDKRGESLCVWGLASLGLRDSIMSLDHAWGKRVLENHDG